MVGLSRHCMVGPQSERKLVSEPVALRSHCNIVVKCMEGSVHQSNMHILRITWICVTFATRLCHSLNVHKSEMMCDCRSIRITKNSFSCSYDYKDQSSCYSGLQDCVLQSWIRDGTCDCNNCEDEQMHILGIYWHKFGNLDKAGQFWIIFFISAILIIWCRCLVKGRLRKNISSSEDIEHSQQPRESNISASQLLPSYYLHTLHRPRSTLPVTEIQRGTSDTDINALATNSSHESNQVRIGT